MQRIFSVKFSMDNRYVLSGSDDTNIRLWKARASEQLKQLLPQERQKQNYLSALKKRFAHQPEIRRIQRHRHVPKQILKARKLKNIAQASKRLKHERRVKHSKPGSITKKPAREEKIVKKGTSKTY